MGLFIGERKKPPEIKVPSYYSIIAGKTADVETAGLPSSQWGLSSQRLAWSLYPDYTINLVHLAFCYTEPFSFLLAGAKKWRMEAFPIKHSVLSAMEEESQELQKSPDSFSFNFPLYKTFSGEINVCS